MMPSSRSKEERYPVRSSPPVAWHEFLPAGAALAASLTSLAGGLASPATLAPPLAIAFLYPLWLAASQHMARREWAIWLRHFLPLLILVPMYFILSSTLQLSTPGHQASATASFFPFLLVAVPIYLYAVLTGAYLGNRAGFKRLSLGLQVTFYGTLLLLAALPFPATTGGGALLITLMTFLLFYDFVYRQPSLIASFLILAMLKVVAGLGVPFAPAAEAIAIVIPALVVAGLKATGFPRR
jgi:hypothetical protein